MDRRTLYTDIDDTLLCHDKSEFPKSEWIEIECNGRTFIGVPHKKNINLLIKFYKLGYEIVAWSKTGKSWARSVVEKLGLQEYIDSYQTKPDFYLDDRPVQDWMGVRVYRDPKTGKE